MWLVNKELDGGSGISRFSGVSKKASKLEGPKREKAYLSGDVGGVPAGHGLQGSLKRIRFSCSQRKSGRSGINKD